METWMCFENWYPMDMEAYDMILNSGLFGLFLSGERKDVVPVKSSFYHLYFGMSTFAHKRKRQATYAEPENQQGGNSNTNVHFLSSC